MPTGPLTIYNDVTITGSLSVTESLLVHNDTLFVDNDTNNVGIGTLDPSTKLNVAGDILASGYIKASGDLYGSNIVYNTGDQIISGNKRFEDNVDITGELSVSGDFNVRVDDLYVDTSTHMVGIGTSIPNAKLTVVGDINCFDNIYADNIYITDGVYGSNIVYNTGDQTISGVKSFLDLKSLKVPTDIDDVVNRDYSNKNLILIKDLTLESNTFLDLSFPTGSLETGFRKISWVLRQSSGNSYTVNYENVNWLNTSPTNPTEDSPIFFETYPQSSTGTQSYGVFLNPIADLEKNKSDIVYRTGNQIISGYKRFEEDVYIKNLYVTGAETIVSSTNTNVSSNYLLLNITGGATDGGVFFVTGSGLTGVNDSGAIIGFDDFENFKFGIGTRSQDLNSLDTIASTKYVDNSVTRLSGFVFDVASTENSIPNTLVSRSSLGYSDFSQIGINETNYPNPNKTTYRYNNITYGFGGSENPDSYKYNFPLKSGEFALDTTAVMLTGNQIVSGQKTFNNRLFGRNGSVYDSTVVGDVLLTDSNPTGYAPTGYNIQIACQNFTNNIDVTGVLILPTGGDGPDSLMRNGGRLSITLGGVNRPTIIRSRIWTGSTYDPNLVREVMATSANSPYVFNSTNTEWILEDLSKRFYTGSYDPIDVTRINGVAVTGNQTINGTKTFVSRPFVGLTGVLLSGEATTESYVTGVSGQLQAQIDTLNSQTGDFVTTSQTGQFYASSNPSGFVINSGGIAHVMRLTQNQYNLLSPPDSNTLYVIIG